MKTVRKFKFHAHHATAKNIVNGCKYDSNATIVLSIHITHS
ncbi:hypothetical protein ESCAB7627_2142 [Escherichia albertii TW07627]|uniref:Uncharacterized protein n=1 Tax=Escherichia albertii (strain TW07627) TaxID=502347 RepID=A0ABC9NKI0_ESCAT|nr:hypothetical protein ESCAB7627_2142 [Escherichia albertii TW07627]